MGGRRWAFLAPAPAAQSGSEGRGSRAVTLTAASGTSVSDAAAFTLFESQRMKPVGRMSGCIEQAKRLHRRVEPVPEVLLVIARRLRTSAPAALAASAWPLFMQRVGAERTERRCPRGRGARRPRSSCAAPREVTAGQCPQRARVLGRAGARRWPLSRQSAASPRRCRGSTAAASAARSSSAPRRDPRSGEAAGRPPSSTRLRIACCSKNGSVRSIERRRPELTGSAVTRRTPRARVHGSSVD